MRSIESISTYREENKRRYIINWIAVVILMIFYAGTWLIPMFYHVTERYNTSIIFVCLGILFLNNVNWTGALLTFEREIWVLGIACVAALVNLFIIHSNKGCFLIIANLLLLWYLCDKVRLDGRQLEFMNAVFVFVFLIWAFKDLAFSYNSNTGASVTTFTFFCAMIFFTRISRKKEIYGLLVVFFVIRLINLILWHLARGAFLALMLFLLFYYVVPKGWWVSKKIFGGLVYFSTFGSIVFVFSYVTLASTGVNFKMPFFYKNLFSGREQIWMEIWNKLKDHILTGIGSGYALESFFEYNIHNVMYDILAVHGIIVFALSLYILIRKMLMMRERFMSVTGEPSFQKVLAASGIFAIAIESFIDMDFMWADYSPVVLFLSLIVFEGGPLGESVNGKRKN